MAFGLHGGHAVTGGTPYPADTIVTIVTSSRQPSFTRGYAHDFPRAERKSPGTVLHVHHGVRDHCLVPAVGRDPASLWRNHHARGPDRVFGVHAHQAAAQGRPLMRLRMGMVGGGLDAMAGELHRRAAALDSRVDLVAGALSSTPERSHAAAKAWGLARGYG